MATTQFLYKGTLTHPTTQYVGVPLRDGSLGVQIAWLDATSSATITLEVTNYDSGDAPVDTAGSAWVWKQHSTSITGPNGTAAGSAIVNAENIRQKRARLKIVTAATSKLEIMDGAIKLP